MDCDVVVAGAGPTGLMLACELALGGARTLVVERRKEPEKHSKAMGMQGRTVELLELRGLLDRFLDGAGLLKGGNFASLGVPMRFEEFDTRHPYVLLVPQLRTEELLAERALELGVRIVRGDPVTGFVQDADGVTVETGGGTLRARYLVGCDGGGSVVRRQAGIGFTGQDPHMYALIGDMRFSGDLPRGEGLGPMRPVGLVNPERRSWFGAFQHQPGVYRATVAWFGEPFPDRNAPVTEEEMRAALVEHTGGDHGMHDVTWLSRLTDVSRLADSYRSGRVLLAGDAAHIHLPAGGQGLNLGIQDAVNLGWKLAAVVRGHGGEELLDSYQSERRPVADGVVHNTRTQAVLIDPDPRYDALRQTFRELMALPDTNRYIAGMLSGFDVRYGTGEHPSVGLRMPDADLLTADGTGRISDHFVEGRGLLLLPEPATAASAPRGSAPAASPLADWADRVTTLTAGIAGAEPDTAFLLRPDGYVAWAGHPARHEELRSAATTWFGAAG
ncbi:FAD-dependent monooxygenase [Kitasatospora sp. NPDC048239]|uniref:FAD-dependent monooxygenase n=1 Tax=Kitasatospora sp. NPDC048239 TaxID=3364046 RepID=UPI003718B0AF